MRVDTEDGAHRFAVCVASYGYMGDLMRHSEKLRWMGPARYNIAGAYTLLRGKAYDARIEYRPVSDVRYAIFVMPRAHPVFSRVHVCKGIAEQEKLTELI